MCIAFYTKPNVTIDDDKLLNSSETNSDGCGIAWIEGGRLKIFTTLKFNIFLAAYHSISKRVPESPKLIHLRKATKGKVNESNCHPFRINDHSCFVHNGTFFNTKSTEDKSDTQVFNEDILQVLPADWKTNGAIVELLENYITSNRLIFLDSDGTVLILNEDMGHWSDDNGWWASNYSYYKGITSLQRTKPTKFQMDSAGIKDSVDYNIPGKDDDWICYDCNRLNYSWTHTCKCGCKKYFGSKSGIKKPMGMEDQTPSRFSKECTFCGEKNHIKRDTCFNCYKVFSDSKVIYLPDNSKKVFPDFTGKESTCTYCGIDKEITFTTKFHGVHVDLCKKCEFMLKHGSTDLYFPTYLFKELCEE